MLKVAAVLAVSSLVALTAACTPTANPRVECGGRSSLSSIDLRSGVVSWRAALGQASEVPMQVEDGTVVVTAPCGAAVVGLADGDVRYDDATPGELVGVTDERLFTLDEPEGGSHPITSFRLDTAEPAGSYSNTTRFQDATVADGSLVTLYGDVLSASDQTGSGPSWDLQVPAYRDPRLVRSGHLVLVTSGDGSVFAVDLADGSLVWRTIPPVTATSYGLRVTSVPGTVLTVASTSDAKPRTVVYATEAATGRLRWTRPAGIVLGADRDLTVLRTPGAVEGVDTVSGTLRWRRPATRIDLPDARPEDVPVVALTRDTVVVPQPGSPALGLDRSTGRVRWRGPETWTVVAAGDVVVTAASDRVTALEARTGAVRWSRPVERDLQELTVAPGGKVLLLDTDIVPHLGA